MLRNVQSEPKRKIQEGKNSSGDNMQGKLQQHEGSVFTQPSGPQPNPFFNSSDKSLQFTPCVQLSEYGVSSVRRTKRSIYCM